MAKDTATVTTEAVYETTTKLLIGWMDQFEWFYMTLNPDFKVMILFNVK